MFENDLFAKRRCVHVKFDKEVYKEFRIFLFKHKLTMQEFLEECARRAVESDASVLSITRRYIKRKTKEKLDECKIKAHILDSTETDAIYDIISDGDELIDERVENEDE